ncbi:hypothetical protein [Nocardia sp. NBC_01009]|uniref:hypothetical protein n=1 Tax=Nocardia sp. NBC_01009 TaxID=2975996 RepID=UPI003868E61D|nr:hypothetical protein OHA42_09645 [Nocardia sp. NBC_01009]
MGVIVESQYPNIRSDAVADDLKHDADLFEKAALKTGHARDRVDGVLVTLEAALAGRGATWGADKLGHQFSEGENDYQVAREKVVTNIENGSKSFDNFASGSAADLARATERFEQAGADVAWLDELVAQGMEREALAEEGAGRLDGRVGVVDGDPPRIVVVGGN